MADDVGPEVTEVTMPSIHLQRSAGAGVGAGVFTSGAGVDGWHQLRHDGWHQLSHGPITLLQLEFWTRM